MAKVEVKTSQTADGSDGSATRDILHFLSRGGAFIRPLSSQRAVAFGIIFWSCGAWMWPGGRRLCLRSGTPRRDNTETGVVVAEWLRRWTRNPLGSPRAGSNPAVYGQPF